MLSIKDRVNLRDKLFNKLLQLKVIIKWGNKENIYKITRRYNLTNALKNDSKLSTLYNLYVSEFRSEEEALHCLVHQDDYTNHICPICGNLCKFYMRKKRKTVKYRYIQSCNKKECVQKVAHTPEATEKSKAKKKEKYGDENYNNREKAKQTCEAHFGPGMDNPMKVPEIQAKAEKTNLDKYKYKATSQHPDVKAKNLETYMKNHCLFDPILVKECQPLLDQIKEGLTLIDVYINNEYLIKFIELLYQFKNRLLTLTEVANIFDLERSKSVANKIYQLELDKYFYIQQSKLELQFIDFLMVHKYNENIDFIRRKRVLNTKNNKLSEIDFLFSKYNIGFEINDIVSHNVKRKDSTYHYNKTLMAKDQHNIRLIHLWEWELNETYWPKISQWILHLLNYNRVKINLHQCIIQYITKEEANTFLNQYSLTQHQTTDVCLGFYYNNELIQVIYFNLLESNLTMNVCTKFGYDVIENSKDIIQYYLQNSGYNYLLTYCNLDKFTGKTFEEMGFKLLKYQAPNVISQINTTTKSKQLYNCGYKIYMLK